MISRIGTVVILVMLALASFAPATSAGPAEDAARAAERGNALLEQGAWEGAAEAFAEAARLDPSDVAWRGELDILRRVMTLRADLADAPDAAKWERTAAALRSYYYGKRILPEALSLDEEAWRRSESPETAARLAETLLEMNRDVEAASLLASQPAAALDPGARMLHGIALARTGDTAGAGRIARDVPVPAVAPPELLVTRARLLAGIGDRVGALQSLERAFAAAPSSLVEPTRKRVLACGDFAGLTATPEFTKLLTTATGKAASSCSMGPSCGACPSRTSCGSREGAATETAPKSCSDGAHKSGSH